jgi:2-polyprenyl-6-methoxyphenol hydroxylase-like FAD-dependent oxidoreductase
LFDTACVLGGSVAGLLAARVLADYASRVVVIERDEASEEGQPRTGVPQGEHLHLLLPGGRRWMEQWLPGLTEEVQAGGGILTRTEQVANYMDGRLQVRSSAYGYLMSSRPFLEARIRASVLGLPNVSALRAQATGLQYCGDEVSGVRYGSGAVPEVLPADIVIDAMGRGSRLSDWLSADGHDRPRTQRLDAAINYTTAMFKRARGPEELELTSSLARFGPPYPADGVAVATVNAVEGDRWILTLIGYDDVRPGRTLEAFRAACAKLPLPFAEAASHALVTEIAAYHQADSRRRDFSGLTHFPARLLSAGDAVASFNPIYGQGMSSAALHAACLAEFLRSGPDLQVPATGFFELQKIVVDAAWAMSAGTDAARLDAISGADVPEEVSRQRWAMGQILQAAGADEHISRAFDDAVFMIAHPSTLADPALLERAIAVNERGI